MKRVIKHLKITADDVLNSDVDFIEPMWWSIDIYNGYKQYKNDLSKFTLPQIYAFAIAWFEAEVSNGGLGQFYENSTGIVWREVLEGFKAIGCEQAAKIIEDSAKLMGGNPSFDRKRRWKQLERYDPDFEALDEEFYKLDYSELMSKYIADNAESFCFEGDIIALES